MAEPNTVVEPKTVAAPEAAAGGRVAVSANEFSLEAVRNLLRAVPDPEIPVLSIVDLGIVRDVRREGDVIVVCVTPTYSGCPATDIIRSDIGRALEAAGIARHRIELQLAPAWTTDWIDADARERLRAYGIAPPGARSAATQPIDVSQLGLTRAARAAVACPRCGAADTVCVSRFGSTPCQAQYRCRACGEPFDHFKPH